MIEWEKIWKETDVEWSEKFAAIRLEILTKSTNDGVACVTKKCERVAFRMHVLRDAVSGHMPASSFCC